MGKRDVVRSFVPEGEGNKERRHFCGAAWNAQAEKKKKNPKKPVAPSDVNPAFGLNVSESSLQSDTDSLRALANLQENPSCSKTKTPPKKWSFNCYVVRPGCL